MLLLKKRKLGAFSWNIMILFLTEKSLMLGRSLNVCVGFGSLAKKEGIRIIETERKK